MLAMVQDTPAFPWSFSRSLLCRLSHLVPTSGAKLIRNLRVADGFHSSSARTPSERRWGMHTEDGPSRSLRGAGDGGKPDAQLAPGELEDLFRSFRRSIFRLETLDDYSEGLEDEEYRSWSHGNAPPPIHGHWWYDGIVRAATSGHKRWDRVHMLRQPLAIGDYLRYSFEYGYTRSEQAGGRCPILEVPEGRKLPLPKEDFWLFDDEFGVVLDFDGQGRWMGAELVTYPPAVNELRRRRDIALALAVPFPTWSSKSANLRMQWQWDTVDASRR